MLGADPIRVLIADDEPALRGALADLLAHEDDVVLIGTAGDADEAIAHRERRTPDVALVDVKMPAGGGARAAREIARCSPDTRVIALSAFEDRPTVLEMLRAGRGRLPREGHRRRGDRRLDPEGHGRRREPVRRGHRRHRRTSSPSSCVARTTSASTSTPAAARSNGSSPAKASRWRSSRSSTSRRETTVGLEALARFPSPPPRPPNEWFAEAVALALGRPARARDRRARPFARCRECPTAPTWR